MQDERKKFILPRSSWSSVVIQPSVSAAGFSAMRAVLALDGFDSKKHSGIIVRFRQSYIKTGIFKTEMSKIIDDLEIIREDSDYDDFYIISKEDAAIRYIGSPQKMSAPRKKHRHLQNIMLLFIYTQAFTRRVYLIIFIFGVMLWT